MSNSDQPERRWIELPGEEESEETGGRRIGEKACESACESGCESACESGCESACESGCESACESGCEMTDIVGETGNGVVGGRLRFTRDAASGVIRDSKTGLEWLVGSDENTTYAAALAWVASLGDVAGGGWRMPTRVELKMLYQKGVGTRNMDPVFETTGWWVWGEPHDFSSAWFFNFHDSYDGYDGWTASSYSGTNRVFVVRPRR